MNKGMEIRRDLELLEKIQDKEERIRALLSPAESYIIWFQKILVWEHPYLTVTLLLVVNILFWLATTWRIYCLVGFTGMVAVALEMWVSYVWSETAGSNGSGASDSESWTEVYPRLLGVPEMSTYLARWWVSGLQWLDSAIRLRAENQPKFFVYSLFFLTCFAVIGIYIPGIYISYFSVMGLLLWPSFSYHNIIGRLKAHVDPIIERMEQKLNIKRRRNKKGGKRRSRRRKQEPADDDSDSDKDIEEFIPPADSLILTTLTKAVMDQSAADEDEDSASYSPSEFTPRMPSQAESHDHTDDELLSEELSLLAHDVKEMPSIDDLDNTQSETQMFLPQSNNETQNAERIDRLLDISEDDSDDDDNEQPFHNPETRQNPADAAGKMTFVASHFKESSDEDEEDKLATGLSFSDMPDVLDVEAKPESESESKVLGVIGGLISQSHSSLVAAFNSPVISQTMSSVMSNTLTGLSVIRSTVASMTGHEVSGSGDVPLPGDAAVGGVHASEARDSRSADLQVLESEFEFLEQEELDLMEGSK